MSKRTLLLALSMGLALLLGGRALATVILPVDLETLCRRADLIVRGTTGATVALTSEDKKLIHSVTTVSVAQAIKGQAPAQIEVRTQGGTVGDITQMVSGAPQFHPGEEVILFLRKANERHFVVESFCLGKFEVVKGQDGTAHVRQAVQGLGILQPDGTVRAAPAFEPVPVEQFVARVKRALEPRVTP